MAELKSHITITDQNAAEKLINAPPKEGYRRILSVDYMHNDKTGKADWLVGWDRVYVDSVAEALMVLSLVMDITAKFFSVEEQESANA